MLFVRFYAIFFHRIYRGLSCFGAGILECKSPSNVYTSVRLESFFLFGRYVVRIGITPQCWIRIVFPCSLMLNVGLRGEIGK
jgi:hypothetical protein